MNNHFQGMVGSLKPLEYALKAYNFDTPLIRNEGCYRKNVITAILSLTPPITTGRLSTTPSKNTPLGNNYLIPPPPNSKKPEKSGFRGKNCVIKVIDYIKSLVKLFSITSNFKIIKMHLNY